MIWRYYYTQHRRRLTRPQHRVQFFLRGTGLIGTLELNTGTGEVTCNLAGKSTDDAAVTTAIELLGEVWSWAGDAMPQVRGTA